MSPIFQTAAPLAHTGVVISGEPLRPPMTGVGRYTHELLAALHRHWGLGNLRVFTGHGLASPEESLAGPCLRTSASAARFRRWLRTIPGSYALHRRWRDHAFRRSVRGMSIYHETAYVLRPFDGACVVTVHDLSHLVHPDMHPRERVRFLEKNLPASLARAQRVLTISEFTRHELMRLFALPGDKIRVTPLAAATSFVPLAQAQYAEVLRRHGLRPKGYLLSVATIEPRKNLEGLLQAYARLPAFLRRVYPLAIAGATGWRYGRIRSRMEPLREKGEAIALGYVPETDLPALMSGCRGFVYPSLYEGFGLPVVEAQACGAPVLTSLRSALPEVAGPASLLVDPEDIAALTEGMRRLCEDEDLAAKALYAGPHFAQRFSWRETARLTIEAYGEALGHPISIGAHNV